MRPSPPAAATVLLLLLLPPAPPASAAAVGCGQRVDGEPDCSAQGWQCRRALRASDGSVYCVRGIDGGGSGCADDDDCYTGVCLPPPLNCSEPCERNCSTDGCDGDEPSAGCARGRQYGKAEGYVCAAIAVVFFGSNFIPVKTHEAGNGIFFQWIVCCGIMTSGVCMLLARRNQVPHEEFHAYATVGGAMWCMGNLLTVPIIKSIGLGLALCIWGTFNMLAGWSSGKFGLLGVRQEEVGYPSANAAGVAVAVLSVCAFASIEPNLDDGPRLRRHTFQEYEEAHDSVVTPAGGGADDDADKSDNGVGNADKDAANHLIPEKSRKASAPRQPRRGDVRYGFGGFGATPVTGFGSTQDLGTPRGETPAGSPSLQQPRAPPPVAALHAQQRRESVSSEQRVPAPASDAFQPGHPPAPETTQGADSAGHSPRHRAILGHLRPGHRAESLLRNAAEVLAGENDFAMLLGEWRKPFGVTLAAASGVLQGFSYDPAQHLADNAGRLSKTGGRLYSADAIDYAFEHFAGIFFASTCVLIAYALLKRCLPRYNRPVAYAAIVLPGLISGVMWAIGIVCVFMANTRLGLVNSFPLITTGPGLVSAFWGVFFFREIGGRRNLVKLALAFALLFTSVALILVSEQDSSGA